MSEARLDTLRRLAAEGPVAVALLEKTAGSTPREEGAWMIVSESAIAGTIGGGEAERRAVEAARRLLAEGRAHERIALPLGPALDQCCGGHMTIALARLGDVDEDEVPLWSGGPVVREETRAPVLVYGAGHVGAALVAALAPLPFDLTWIDARAAALWPDNGPVPCRRLALPEAAAAMAPDDAIHLVMTHSHAVDLEICAAVLAGRFRFLGLIGSATKRATFARRLEERRLDPSRLTCPIGLPQIEGKAPAVIAASVAAQLLTLSRHGS